MVNIEFSGRFPSGMGKEETTRLVRKALKMSGDMTQGTLSLSLVGDKEIRKLNKKWRGINKATDVLSFNYPQVTPFLVGKGGASPQLGDIVISMNTVRKQAKQNKRTIREELAVMVVHGCLHLMGFDHDTPRKENKMFCLQHDILISFGVL